MPNFPALGIDVGGGSAKIGLVSPEGELLADTVEPTDPSLPATTLLDRYLDAAEELKRSAGIKNLCGIGIGLPGHIDFASGTTRFGNVPCLDDFPIASYIGNKTQERVLIENDATLAALAEFYFGAGRGSTRFITVALGTGIGVGFIENGQPIHTSNGTLGDIGHMIVDPFGSRKCRLGCCGCLESVASALALEERFASVGGERHGRGLGELFRSAHSGDAECAKIIDEAAIYIGAAVASWMHIFAPDRVAFAGGMSEAGDDLLAPVFRAVKRFALPVYFENVILLPATLGAKSGVIGAATLCLRDSNAKRTHQ